MQYSKTKLAVSTVLQPFSRHGRTLSCGFLLCNESCVKAKILELCLWLCTC